MNIAQLLKKANTHYDDGYLEVYFDAETGDPKEGKGDVLAEFIVAELQENFDPNASDYNQLDNAIKLMETAKNDLLKVIKGLRQQMDDCRWCENLVDINPPRTKWVGGCRFGLRPGTCGRFELAKCFDGHDPR